LKAKWFKRLNFFTFEKNREQEVRIEISIQETIHKGLIREKEIRNWQKKNQESTPGTRSSIRKQGFEQRQLYDQNTPD